MIKKVQKSFQCNFRDHRSIGFIVKTFIKVHWPQEKLLLTPTIFWEQVSHTERLCWWVGNNGPTGILRIKHKISPPPSLQNFKDYLIQNPLLLPKKNHGITNQGSKDFAQTQTVSRLSGEILKNDACHIHFFYVLFLSLFLLFLCTVQFEIFDS